MFPATGRQQTVPEWAGAPESFQLRRFPTGRVIMASSRDQERKEIRTELEGEGHDVVEVETADQAIEEACSGVHNLLILDSAIAGLGPCEVCRSIRPKSNLGIIVLSRDTSSLSRIDALNAGADDYIPSRFVMAELQARVRALLRRVSGSLTRVPQIVLEDRTIDLASRKIKMRGGRVTSLTPKEYEVLQELVTRVDKSVTHATLAQTVWQREGKGEIEYLRIVIGQLRRKLEPEPDNPRYIVTERAVGYRFHLPSAEGTMTARCA
jgi:two-component system KDP operon response regulator KdpE